MAFRSDAFDIAPRRHLALAAAALVLLVSGWGAPASAAQRWDPPPRLSWQWQLSGALNTRLNVDVYDVDLFRTPASVVRTLHNRGRKVICYMSAGSWERFRPDRAAFPPSVLGRPLAGWPDERWLDIRRIPALAPVMEARLDMCAAKGFDGVELDNVDGYVNNSGFPLTARHQLAYNRYLAAEAHKRGLAVGLKNDLDQVQALEGAFDFAVNEQCFQYRECAVLRRFIAAGKPVFHVEYNLSPARFCAQARALGFSSMRKRRSLDAFRQPC